MREHAYSTCSERGSGNRPCASCVYPNGLQTGNEKEKREGTSTGMVNDGGGMYAHFLMTMMTTTIMMITTMRAMKKQIHRFFRAERADATAFSVYPRLWWGICEQNLNQKEDCHSHPTSVSFSTVAAVASIVLICSSCCSTKTLIFRSCVRESPLPHSMDIKPTSLNS